MGSGVEIRPLRLIVTSGLCIRRGSAFLSNIDFSEFASLAVRIALLAEEACLTIHALPRVIPQKVAQAMKESRAAACPACCL